LISLFSSNVFKFFFDACLPRRPLSKLSMQPKMVQANSRVNQLKKISQHADRERKITVKSTTRWMRKEK